MTTALEIHRATWIPFSKPPEGEQVELLAPWMTENPRRILTAVRIDDETFVIARDSNDIVTNTWKVLL